MSEETDKKKPWWEIVTALTPLILGVCVTAVGVFFTQVYNYRQLQLNQLQLQLNQLAVLDKLRPQLISNNDLDRVFAYNTFLALGYKDLVVKLIQANQDSAGRAVVQEIQQSATGTTKAEATATLSSLPVQVYMQLADEKQKIKANTIRTILQAKGYVVPDIGDVVGKAPKITEVRYFNNQDKPIAEAIVTVLQEQRLTSAQASPVSRYKVKPGSLEIWFSADAM